MVRSIAHNVGDRHGRWTIIENDVARPAAKKKRRYALCRCDCGTTRAVSYESIMFDGRSSSCGCISRERAKTLRVTHGRSDHPLYRVYRSMLSRCNNPNATFYKYYGGRGIKVADEWCDFSKFLAWSMGRWSPGTEIDRINNDLGYSPENCRFTTRSVQARNTRRNKRYFVNGGWFLPVEIEEQFGLASTVFRDRIRRGKTPEQAING